MTTVNSPGTRIASRTAEPKRFRQIATGPGPLTRFEDRTGLTGNDMSPDDLRELIFLEEFLTHHVRPDGLRDVQCMLLWSEWVRVYQKQTHRFPCVILEKEFREAITGRLGVDIAYDEILGAIYPGLRFVP